ncbi:Carboxylesterase NlhH [Lachnellula suecica]|uniref:Carboxylesterase NlhH n=1 Tax=Lachnellula suecica TaxID=602035 RepID=A0A8T9C899_9HELO|nr:Carboxylesterase NlhH [Lachnellula suecica]
MDSSLIFQIPPPLDPEWLAHEKASNLLIPKPTITEASERQKAYSNACKALNTCLLTGRDQFLKAGLRIQDSLITSPNENHSIPIRSYTPSNPQSTCKNTVIYYHGGGLFVGDLDSEDLSCRRISKALHCTVYSVDYRLMPQHTADDALTDALVAFKHISHLRNEGKLVLVGSSSGGQLAAQVSQLARSGSKIHGVLLRGPVTCNAANLPAHFRNSHVSMSAAFYTSLLSSAALTAGNRTKAKLPLEEEDLDGLPRHWMQVCTNDIYYSDGLCYAEALRGAGVETRLHVLIGWPHTFWLKAPLLERAVEAEKSMLEGVRWLLEM